VRELEIFWRWQKNGWKTVGVEPSDKARAIALKKAVSFVEDTSGLESHSLT
jgi:hypothetical protein